MIICLRKIRKRKGITLIELSKMTGMSKTTLQSIEADKVSPKMSQMEKIAEALDVYIEELYKSKRKRG